MSESQHAVRARWAVAIGAVAAAALLARCNCGDSNSTNDAAGQDGGRDASKPPADAVGNDDATADTGSDVLCAAPGQTIHDFVGYTRVNALDPCCTIDVPDDLATVPPMAWEPCSTGRLNCQQFKVTWTNADGPERFAFGRRYAATSGPGSFEVAIWRGATIVEDIVYDLASSTPLKAWRSDQASQCFASSASNTTSVIPIAFAQTERFRLSVEPRDAGPMLDAAFFGLGDATLGKKVDAIGTYDVSDLAIAFAMGPTGSIVVGAPTGPFVRARTPSHLLFEPFVHDGLILALAEHGNAGYAQLDHVDLDGTITTYLAEPQTHISAPAVADNRIFWVQASGAATFSSPPTVCELWSAPLSAATPPLQARSKIATLPNCGVVSNSFAVDGYVALRLGPDRLVIVRASDGTVRSVDSTSGRHFGSISNVTGSEVWATENGEKGNEVSLALVRIAFPVW